mmetsp:Transcript_28246/g.57032  ORF Transcript_28246/g.57032 Transcript_28246/m.57032 type:complete len:93 (-) Transcript_28246:210-488(-)
MISLHSSKPQDSPKIMGELLQGFGKRRHLHCSGGCVKRKILGEAHGLIQWTGKLGCRLRDQACQNSRTRQPSSALEYEKERVGKTRGTSLLR